MLVVEEGGGDCGDEELATVCVGAGVLGIYRVSSLLPNKIDQAEMAARRWRAEIGS